MQPKGLQSEKLAMTTEEDERVKCGYTQDLLGRNDHAATAVREKKNTIS